MAGLRGDRAFAFPFDVQALIDEVGERYGKNPEVDKLLHEVLEPMLVDRDRAIEDALSGTMRRWSGMPFITVASDGTGDYLSIAAAINAVPTNAGQPTTIWVKPGTYDDGTAVPSVADKKIILYAGAGAPMPGPTITPATDFLQDWTCNGITSSGTNNGTLFVAVGMRFQRSSGSSSYFNGSSGPTLMALINCYVVATGSTTDGFGSQTNALVLINTSLGGGTGAVVGSGGTFAGSMFAVGSNFATGITLGATYSGRVFWHGCLINGATGAFTGSRIIMGDLSFGNSAGTMTFTLPSSGFLSVVGCVGPQAGATLSSTDWSVSGATGSASVTFSGNTMPTVRLSVTGNSTARLNQWRIDGSYATLALGAHNTLATVALDLISASSLTALAITGDNNMVMAALNNGSGSSNTGVSLASGADNNIVIATGLSGFGTASSDSGSGNTINSFPGPPTGTAGGDLSGSYPNPSVVDDSHGHTMATLPAEIVTDAELAALGIDDLADVDTSGASDGDALTYDAGNNEWVPVAPPPPGGDVSGPGSSTDDRVARWNGTSGTALSNSGVRLTDSDQLGIGVDPSAKLHVAAGSGSATTAIIDGGTTDPIPLDVRGEGTANNVKFRVTNTGATSTARSARFSLDANTTTQVRSMLEFRAQWSDNTDATRTALVTWSAASSGSFTDFMVIKGTDIHFGGTDPQGVRARITADAEGSEVTRVESPGSSTTDKVSLRQFQYDRTTTNATLTNMAHLDLGNLTSLASTTDLVATFIALVTARRTNGSGEGAGYIVNGAVKVVSGTASLIGTPTVLGYEDDATWDCQVAVSGDALRINIRGAASQNIDWHATIQLCPIST